MYTSTLDVYLYHNGWGKVKLREMKKNNRLSRVILRVMLHLSSPLSSVTRNLSLTDHIVDNQTLINPYNFRLIYLEPQFLSMKKSKKTWGSKGNGTGFQQEEVGGRKKKGLLNVVITSLYISLWVFDPSSTLWFTVGNEVEDVATL